MSLLLLLIATTVKDLKRADRIPFIFYHPIFSGLGDWQINNVSV